MSYTQVSHAELLAGVKAARAWLDEVGVPTNGTRLAEIEGTLARFLGDLESRPAAEVIAEWDWSNKQDAYYALIDGHAFSETCENLSTLTSDRLPRGELKRALQGPLVPSTETPDSTTARNHFLELDLASRLIGAGVEVTGFDDVRFDFDSISYVVQCKRPFSAKSVAANVEGAWKQIEERAPTDSHRRGIIAIEVDKVMGLDSHPPIGIQGHAEINNIVRDLSRRFKEDHRAAWQGVVDNRLVGVFLVFRFVCLTALPVNTVSAVNIVTVVPLARSGTKDHARLKRLQQALASAS